MIPAPNNLASLFGTLSIAHDTARHEHQMRVRAEAIRAANIAAIFQSIFALVELADSERRLLTQQEAAKALGVSVQTVHRWRKAGLIGYVQMPGGDIRYRWNHIDDFIASREHLSKAEAARRRTRAAAA